MILLPLPTFHIIPIKAAFAAHKTPFQKGEVKESGHQNILGLFILYLWSTVFVQMELEFKS